MYTLLIYYIILIFCFYLYSRLIFVCITGVYMNLKALHGILHEVKDANSYLFTKETTILKTVHFPEIILPETERNDIYIRLKTGIFPKYSKKSDKNVEVQVIIFTKYFQYF